MILELNKEELNDIILLNDIISNNYDVHFDVENEFKTNVFSKFLIYKESNKIIGFVNYYDMYDRFEIAHILVIKEYQNKKIGSKLMEQVIEIGKNKNIMNITLEVKSNNVAAIKLYEKYNFEKVAIRKNYYNGIDGILMERKMM